MLPNIAPNQKLIFTYLAHSLINNKRQNKYYLDLVHFN